MAPLCSDKLSFGPNNTIKEADVENKMPAVTVIDCSLGYCNTHATGTTTPIVRVAL